MDRLRRLRGTALVVEDEVLVAEAICASLRAAGVSDARHCSTTTEAIQLLAELGPQIIVLDVGLADRDDGWALAELASQISVPPPVIVFSTGSPEKVPPSVAALGVVCMKPCDPEAIVDIIASRREAVPFTGVLRAIGSLFGGKAANA